MYLSKKPYIEIEQNYRVLLGMFEELAQDINLTEWFASSVFLTPEKVAKHFCKYSWPYAFYLDGEFIGLVILDRIDIENSRSGIHYICKEKLCHPQRVALMNYFLSDILPLNELVAYIPQRDTARYAKALFGFRPTQNQHEYIWRKDDGRYFRRRKRT